MTTFFDLLVSHYEGRQPVSPLCGGCRMIDRESDNKRCGIFKIPESQWRNGACQLFSKGKNHGPFRDSDEA